MTSTSDIHPVDMAVIESGHDKTTLDEIIDCLRGESHRLTSGAKAFMASGLWSEPDAQVVRQIVRIDAATALAELVKKHEHGFRTLVKKPERRI